MNKLSLLALAIFAAFGLLSLASNALQDDSVAIQEELRPAHIPVPADDGRPAMLEGWDSLDCAECHNQIASEWASTMHAMAWVDERYQEAIATKRRPQSCYGCHIPQPLNLRPLGGKPRPRGSDPEALDETPHNGISCLSCHLGPEGAMLGPYADTEATEAHTSKQGEAFGEGALADSLCINCHRSTVGPVIGIAKDFETTRQADKGLSCVGCHMPAIDRPAATVTNEDGTKRATAVRRGRLHSLQTPRDPYFLATAFGVEARRTSTGAELLITNQAGHRIPGLTTRSMTFTVTAIGAEGEATHVFDSTAYLPVDGTYTLAIESGAPPTSLQIHGTHSWTGVETPVVFLDQTLEL